MPDTVDAALERRVLTGEAWSFPSELARFESGLTTPEQYVLTKWWENLRPRSKPKVREFLERTQDFYRGAVRPTLTPEFRWKMGCALYAIGSTARLEQYHDVDFLLITNLISRDLPELDPIPQLEDAFFCRPETDFEEQYHAHFPDDRSIEVPRVVYRLVPKNRTVSLHLSLQPEVESRAWWEENDSKPKVFIYSVIGK